MAQVTLPPCFLVAGAVCAAGAVVAAGAAAGCGAPVGLPCACGTGVAGGTGVAAAGAVVGAAGFAAAAVGAAAGAAGWHAASSCALNAAPAVMPMARSTARLLIHCRVALASQSQLAHHLTLEAPELGLFERFLDHVERWVTSRLVSCPF